MSYRQSVGGATGAAATAPRPGGSSASPRVPGGGAGSGKGGAVRRGVAGKTARGSNSGGLLRYYTDDSPGLKIGPTVVLVSSLMLITFVVLLHIWGKFNR
eukprot:TRINITY_DN222_c0_g1_i1.p1 TRINITY_DN222_c0_g1~~TRINITY_DN222_c0_g1_i1.p1  ORF type:complete len:100 (+),score=8.85 TRINITY_DN222_c0_g1_i1:51-350(+)